MTAVRGLAAGLLDAVERAAQAAGERLREEFFRSDGPRGARSKAPVDTETEAFLREALQALLACSFLGEETGFSAGARDGHRWVVDPHDGTSEFLKGNRGSAVSIALLGGEGLSGSAPDTEARAAEIVLGVVHCPLSPDRGADTIAWAKGCGPLRRNGRALDVRLGSRRLERGELIWTTASAALRPHAFSRALAPARFVAMPSIAYRLARIAAGDGAATLSLHSVNEYDIAAGAALVRAAGGVLHDATGNDIVFTGAPNALVRGCIAGAPDAVRALGAVDWDGVLREPKIAPRIALGFPRRADEARLARAQGGLLGLLIGSQDGGGRVARNAAGALVLARAITREKRYDPAAALAAHGEWRASLADDAGDAPGAAIARSVPIGICATGDSARAAQAARADASLTQPGAACAESSAGFAAAMAAGVAGDSLAQMRTVALANCGPEGRDVVASAFRTLGGAQDFERVLIDGTSDPAAAALRAIAAALFGALHGRAAIPERRVLGVLACRPGAETGASLAWPMSCWPDDALDLAEALLAASH